MNLSQRIREPLRAFLSIRLNRVQFGCFFVLSFLLDALFFNQYDFWQSLFLPRELAQASFQDVVSAPYVGFAVLTVGFLVAWLAQRAGDRFLPLRYFYNFVLIATAVSVVVMELFPGRWHHSLLEFRETQWQFARVLVGLAPFVISFFLTLIEEHWFFKVIKITSFSFFVALSSLAIEKVWIVILLKARILGLELLPIVQMSLAPLSQWAQFLAGLTLFLSLGGSLSQSSKSLRRNV